MEVRLSSHCAYRLQYHVVWVCKYRRRILKPGVRDYLHKVLLGLLKSMPGTEIETIGFDGDHLHMVMVIPPKYAIADVMGRLKSQSSSRMRRKFDWLAKVYWNENIMWSPGYFISSVGVDEETIKRYVEFQGQQDEGQLRKELWYSEAGRSPRTPALAGGIYGLKSRPGYASIGKQNWPQDKEQNPLKITFYQPCSQQLQPAHCDLEGCLLNCPDHISLG